MCRSLVKEMRDRRSRTAPAPLPTDDPGSGALCSWRAGVVKSVGPLGGELLEHPLGPERCAAIRAAANLHVVARARVERQSGLGGIPVVVLLDELVDALEWPGIRHFAPAPG